MSSQDLLNEQEYIAPAKKRSPFFNPLVVVLTAYILFILYELIVKGITNRLSDIPVVLILIVFPFIGFLLFIFNKKAGWIICSLFFMFFTFVAVAFLAKQAFDRQVDIAYQNIFIMAVSISASFMLSLKSIRKQYNINAGIYFTVITISFLFAAFSFYITHLQ